MITKTEEFISKSEELQKLIKKLEAVDVDKLIETGMRNIYNVAGEFIEEFKRLQDSGKIDIEYSVLSFRSHYIAPFEENALELYAHKPNKSRLATAKALFLRYLNSGLSRDADGRKIDEPRILSSVYDLGNLRDLHYYFEDLARRTETSEIIKDIVWLAVQEAESQYSVSRNITKSRDSGLLIISRLRTELGMERSYYDKVVKAYFKNLSFIKKGV